MSFTLPLVFTKTGHPGSVRVLPNNTESLSPAWGPVFSCQTLDVRCCMLASFEMCPSYKSPGKVCPRRKSLRFQVC